jgi:hypothetical protein
MFYIIQENLFKEENYDQLEQTLFRFGLDYEIVQIFADSETVNFKTAEKNVFVFGAMKLSRLAKVQEWFPGSLMNENHNFEVYQPYYKDNLLNADSTIYQVKDDFFKKTDESLFIRPCEDTKAFTGRVFNQIEWEAFKNQRLNSNISRFFNEATKIQIAHPKLIQKEIRVWIVDGEPVTWSLYKLGNQVFYTNQIEQEAIDFASKMAKIFEIAPAFVMDICLSEDQWKIVECNCINIAGFYDADLQKLIISLENKFNL